MLELWETICFLEKGEISRVRQCSISKRNSRDWRDQPLSNGEIKKDALSGVST